MVVAFDSWAASSPFCFSFILTAIFFTMVYCFFTAYYQENDDVFKIFFAKGIGTGLAPSEYLGDSNILAGLFLRRLYTWNNHFPWYAFYLSVPLFGGIWATGAALFLAGGRALRLRYFFFLTLSIGLFTYYLYTYEFTISAQIASQGALFLLAVSFKKDDSFFRFKAYFFAFALIVAACIIRLDALLLTLVVASPWMICFAWRHRRKCFHWKWLGYVALVSLFVAGATLFSRAYYNNVPDWKQFQEFNHLIKSLHDYRNVVYNEQTKPYFDEVGWTYNDVSMFRDYCYVDTGINNMENYRKLILHFSRFTNAGKLATVTSLGQLFRDSQALIVFTLILVFFLFLGVREKLYLEVEIFWLMGIFLILIYFMRCPQRLYLPCLSFVALLELFGVKKHLRKLTGGIPSPYSFLRGFAMLFFIAALSFIVISDYCANQKQVMIERSLKKNVSIMRPDDRQLFVIWGSSFPYEAVHAFDDFEIFRHFNIYPLAVFQRSPHGVNLLRRYGIQENLFLEMRDRLDIFLICKPFEGLYYEKYMMEKYSIKIRAEEYFGSQLFKAYSIKTDDKSRKGLGLGKKKVES
jgi:hypothetical protein